MKVEGSIAGQQVSVQENILDRMIRYVNPIKANARLQSRLQSQALSALAGGYVGASRSRRSMSSWNPGANDADGDVLSDLPVLRERSRDSVRNNALASGAINTAVTGTIGIGSTLKAQVDQEVLAMSDEDADAWENNTQREWKLFWNSFEVDAARRLTGADLEELYFRSVLENGDTFALMPSIPRRGVPYSMKVQLIEADRVTNKGNKADSLDMSGGIGRSKSGAPLEYHILTTHPGNTTAGTRQEWQTIRAFGRETGRKNIIHGYRQLRIGQNRGVPYLSTVIELLKQLTRYTEAELMAAVVSSMFTVFIKSSNDQGFPQTTTTSDFGQNAANEEMKLGTGAIVGLGMNEEISTANPGRPNTAYDPFVMGILRQIGSQLEIPFEVLIKHFTASFSASRAALLEVAKFFRCRQSWTERTFLNVVYENWMMEAVAIGRISAPGFLSDPLLRQAYLGKEWIWMPMGAIDEVKQIKAARERIDSGVSTIERETIEINGGSWDRNHKQSEKEVKARTDDGLIVDKTAELEPVVVGKEDD